MMPHSNRPKMSVGLVCAVGEPTLGTASVPVTGSAMADPTLMTMTPL